MESNFSTNRYWSRRRYERLNGEGSNIRRTKKVVRLGRLRKLRPIKKLRSLVSPLKLWRKFKDAYMEMMLRLAGSVGDLNTRNGFGGKRIPRGRDVKLEYSKEEFENRIVYEIYKSLAASRQLGSAYA